MPDKEKAIYLTFDDGPHETITPAVLKLLAQHNAKATFFCIGNNVLKNPAVYRQIISEGHAVGNHTNDHLNGWKTKDGLYINNIKEAARHISGKLFRPPYGRITKFQAGVLQKAAVPFNIIMWSVLSGDFDVQLSPQKCVKNVLRNTKAGSIIVFHDSEKSYQRMIFALPRVLEHFAAEGYAFKALENIG